MIIGRMLDNEDYIVVAFKGAATWKFYKGNLIVARAQKQNTLYVMHARL